MHTDSVGHGFERGTEGGLCLLHKVWDLSWEDVKAERICQLAHSFGSLFWLLTEASLELCMQHLGFQERVSQEDQAETVLPFMTRPVKSQEGIAAIVQTNSVSRGGNIDPIPQWEKRPKSKSHCEKSLWDKSYCYSPLWKMQSATALLCSSLYVH